MAQLLATILPLVAMFAIMYFLLILPEKKRTKKYNTMLSELKVNDQVLTRGGIVGKIITIEDEQMVIQSGPDRVRFRITKNAIAQKLNKERIIELISKYGGSSLAHYVFVGDKYVHISKKEDVFFQYQIISDKIIVLGGPIGNREAFSEAIKEFYDLADLYGYTLVFSGVDMNIFPELHDMGYDFLKLGQDALVKLDEFSLAGNKNKSKRQAVSRIDKAGYTFSIETPPFTDELFKELKEVSDEWLNGKKEKGFAVGYFNKEYMEMDKIAIVRNSEGEIKAFANIMPMYDGNKTLSIDLMRFKNIELNGIMDFIFVNLFEYGKENGYEFFNLGLVPLADVGESNYSFIREKIAYQIFNNGNFIYSFKGLKKFKDKYASKWDDKYIAYKKESSLLITCIQLLTILSQDKKD